MSILDHMTVEAKLRHPLSDFEAQYKMVPLTEDQLYLLHTYAVEKRNFSCIQELIYRIPWVDIFDIESHILVERYDPRQVYECFQIKSDLSVSWLGFAPFLIVSYLTSDNRRRLEFHPYVTRVDESCFKLRV